MMRDTPCYAKVSDPLPNAIWIPSSSFRVYRGSPSEMVSQMAAGDPPKKVAVRDALKSLTQEMAQARKLHIQLPWNQPDDVIAALFVHALMMTGISQKVPEA